MVQRSGSRPFRRDSEELQGAGSIVEAFSELAARCKENLLISYPFRESSDTDDSDLRESYFRTIAVALSDASDRGIKIRVVTPASSVPEIAINLTKDVKLDVKRLDTGPIGFVLFDSKEIMIITREQYSEDLFFYRAALSGSEGLIDLFLKHFEELWKFAH